MGPRDILNKLKWGGGGIEGAKVTILHRGVPEDKRVITGDNILGLGHGFMRVVSPEGEVDIPYHRIMRIEVGGQVKYEKRGA